VEPPPVAAPAPVMAAPAAPVAPSPQPTATAPQIAHPSEDRAGYRTEAMNRRRQLRADRLTRAG
ncbi:MAG TPA: dihydrolipoamide succinyltransferase, partial [Paracoccaceae bacterium]